MHQQSRICCDHPVQLRQSNGECSPDKVEEGYEAKIRKSGIEDNRFLQSSGTDIHLTPIGYVRSMWATPSQVPIEGGAAKIEILPKYCEGLTRICEHSHIWVMTWFHKARRDMLTASPVRINPDAATYGVFGLRTPVRPNPISLTAVELIRIDDLSLFVEGLDAVDGTPVLDIKPYYEKDIVFSAATPYIRNVDPAARLDLMLTQALAHHREICPELLTAVRMGFLVDQRLGQLVSPELTLAVTGPRCLADALQGLTRSRFANPPRLSYWPDSERCEVLWRRNGDMKVRVLRMVPDRDAFYQMADQEIFEIMEKV